MQASRRQFLRRSLLASGAVAAASFLPKNSFAAPDENKLTILHTNDMHSHLEPFPMDGSTYQGLGGVAPRAALINSIRAANKQVLLLDAGDVFGDTPYYKAFCGEPEIRAMSMMQYDAVTIGDHDLATGIDNYAAMMAKHANFPTLICNYRFTNTALDGKTLAGKVFQKGRIKVGVLGVGINLNGLVPQNISDAVGYEDPIACANRVAGRLKKNEGCDMIICLSHLGDRYYDGRMSDEILAKETYDIDLILGGHTHKFFNEPIKFVNKKGKEVVVNGAGWAGIGLGRLDYTFLSDEKKILNGNTVLIGKNYED